jgi:GR25 family glycosyltransferase involved in LPS biosynthesis
MVIKNTNDIKNILYINLEHRTDRKVHIEHELSKMKWRGERFNAVKLTSGALGCSFSQIKCLDIALQNDWDHVLICEDDLAFLDAELLTKQLNGFFQSQLYANKPWDVILLAGNNFPPSEKVNEYCIRVGNCQTACGYIVNKHYIPKLLENFKEGCNLLCKYPDQNFLYAVDMYWKSLQLKDNWYLITPLSVVQAPGYSDVEKRQVNYIPFMTHLKI